MPLSDEEMRLLEQMERALVEEDPKFASTLRGTGYARATRVRILASGLVFVVGIAALMTGAIMSSRLGVVIAIVGFVLMLGSATLGLSAWRGRQAANERPTGDQHRDSGQAGQAGLSVIQGGKAQRARRPRTPKQRSTGSFMEKLEQRWQRRRDQR